MAAAETVEQLAPLTVDDIVKRVVEISTLPQVALRVLDVARDSESGAADLKQVVEGDPALSARVIRLVNSAAYGIRTRVTNLQQAISYLGFSQVRNLAMTASVAEVFKIDRAIGKYTRSGLWRHMVSVAVAARMIASRCGLARFEDAFLAGLLHDIGLALADQHVHARFAEMICRLRPGTPITQIEREIIGFDHCELGDAVARQWRFPEAVRAAIEHHHASFRYEGPETEIVQCVEIANAICTAKGIPSVGEKLIRPPLEAFQAVGFRKSDVIVLATDLDQEFERERELFEL